MTTPAPQLPNLAVDVADLMRRVRSIERVRPSGPVELQIGCWPHSGGDTSRWARSTTPGWAQHWVWHQRPVWTTHTVRVHAAADPGVSYQLQVTCDADGGGTLWTSEVLTGTQLVGNPIPLAQIPVTATAARFALEARVIVGSGAVYTVPEMVAFTQPRRA